MSQWAVDFRPKPTSRNGDEKWGIGQGTERMASRQGTMFA